MINYTKERFKWGVKTPTHDKFLHLLIRNSKNKKIMAVCTGDVKKYVVKGKTLKMAEGNFMCVHSKLRGKRLAAVLFAEQLRRHRKMGVM